MLIFSSILGSGALVKTYFVLGSATVSAIGTCGGSSSSLFMLSSISNGKFIIRYTYFNEIAVMEGGSLSSVIISSASCF